MVVVKYVVATTDPLKFVRWASSFWQILEINEHLDAISYQKPNCGHSGCIVYTMILSKIPGGVEVLEEVKGSSDEIHKLVNKLVQLIPKCGEDFPEFAIKVVIE